MYIFKFSFFYFLIIFSAGFILGIIRNLWLNSLMNPLHAIMLEVPLMLLLSKIVSTKLLRRYQFSSFEALIAGWVAFAKLILAEYLTFLAFKLGMSSEFFLAFFTTKGIVGLIGQIGFALFPWVIVNSFITPKRE